MSEWMWRLRLTNYCSFLLHVNAKKKFLQKYFQRFEGFSLCFGKYVLWNHCDLVSMDLVWFFSVNNWRRFDLFFKHWFCFRTKVRVDFVCLAGKTQRFPVSWVDLTAHNSTQSKVIISCVYLWTSLWFITPMQDERKKNRSLLTSGSNIQFISIFIPDLCQDMRPFTVTTASNPKRDLQQHASSCWS